MQTACNNPYFGLGHVATSSGRINNQGGKGGSNMTECCIVRGDGWMGKQMQDLFEEQQ